MKDKVIIITGAGSGIGRTTAILAGSKGAKVVSDVNQEGGIATVDEINKNGGSATFIHCDVTDKEQVKDLFAQSQGIYERIDCLVNNAGIGGETNPTHMYSDETYEKVMAINVSGVFYCMKEALRIMLEQGQGGTIVNISSVAGIGAAAGMSAYAASKHAVIGFTKTAAQEYGKYNIRVNAVCPTVIETPMTEGFMQGDPKSVEMIKYLIPMRRFGKPEEVANTIIWLSSSESSFINGQELKVDGGMKA